MPVSATPRQFKRRLRGWLLLLLLLVVAVLLGQYFWQSPHDQYSDNAYIKADVVWVTAPISGELTALSVQAEQQVVQGAPLAVIEDTEQASRYAQINALAELKTAAFEIHQQTEAAQQVLIEGLHAEQRIAQLELKRLGQAQQRQRLLLQAGLVSVQSVEALQAQLDATAAQIGSLNAAIQAAERQQQVLFNRRAQLEQELQIARQNTSQSPMDDGQVQVIAPIAGRVSSLNATLNGRVTQGARLMALTAPDSLYVEAWFEEPQVAQMQLGQPVEIRLDAYPTSVLRGQVSQLRPEQPLPPLQNSRVRRLPVRINLLDTSASAALTAGLAASVRVDLRPQRTVEMPE